MSLTREEIVERGRREWEEKSEHDRDWRGWLHIGEALDVGRREVENRIANRSRSGTPARFKGRAFNERFGFWLTENGFKDLGGKRYAATRSHLMDCLENKAAIETWRKGLQGYQRTAWNHPTTVLRHWKKHFADEQEEARLAAGSERAPKQPSPLAKANEAIRNLIDENDRLRKAPREGDLFKWGEGYERIAKVLVADALANGCSPDKIRSIASGMLSELKATAFVSKEKPASRRKRDGQPKARQAKGEPASPPEPVIPPWCKAGPQKARLEALQQALHEAGTAGLGFLDVAPPDINHVAGDRGVDAVHTLKDAGTVVQVEDRYYLQRFAPSAEAEAPPEDAPQPEVADASIPPVLTKLQAAGDKGMSTYELMQAEGFNPVSLAAVLAPLREARSVIERAGRYYHAAAQPQAPADFAKIVAALQAAGKEGLTSTALHSKTRLYGATFDAAVAKGVIRRQGDRYFAPPSDPAM